MKKDVVKFIMFSMLALILAAVTACGTPSPSKTALDAKGAASPDIVPSKEADPYAAGMAALYSEAKKEGTVVYWSASDQELMVQLIKGFNNRYPGIKVESFETQAEPAIEKVITEKSAGKLSVDVIEAQLGNAPTLIKRDLLEPVDYPNLNGNDLVYYENRLVTSYHLSYPIVYNTEKVKAKDVPTSYEDLLDPKWKGKIAIESRGTLFPILAQSWGEQKMIAYLESLLKQKPLIIKGGTPVADAVASGQADIALGSYIYKTEVYKKKGAPVEWAKVGPIPAVPKVEGVLKGAPHPNSAKLFIAWLTSKEGRQIREDTQSAGLETGTGHLSAVGKLLKEKNIEELLVAKDYIDKQAEWQEKVGGILSSLTK